jgi:thiol-disulfide isomerase/thioredoxin
MKIANKIVMTLAGLVLIAASILKINEMLVVCIPGWRGHGIWESWEFTLLQIPIELCLGLWLISGLFRKAAWLAGTLAYCGFIFVTLYKGMIGAESCGCFGQIHVNPWITLGLIDTPMFLILLLNQPSKDYKLLPPPWPNVWHALIFAAPIFGVLILAAPMLVALRPVCVKAEEAAKVVVLYKDKIVYVDRYVKDLNALPAKDPNTKLTTNPLPKPDPNQTVTQKVDQWSWLQYIDSADQLKEGMVVVLMYHHDCPTCAKIVPLYDEYYRKMEKLGDTSMKFAFIAIPPYSDKGPVPANTVCLKGKLSDAKKWEIMSPYVVALIDGQLIKTWKQGTAPEPDKIMDELFPPQ